MPVEVAGALRLDGPSGRAVNLVAEGPKLRLTVPGWDELRGLAPRRLRSRRRSLAAAVRWLRRLGLSLDIVVGGRHALGLGEGVRPSLLARLLGLGSTDLRLSTVLSFLLR